jgi:predicted metal-dependent HD superfamily phosphohydrolase
VRSFLGRATLFHTPAFAALEPLARQNLALELRGLDAPGEPG